MLNPCITSLRTLSFSKFLCLSFGLCACSFWVSSLRADSCSICAGFCSFCAGPCSPCALPCSGRAAACSGRPCSRLVPAPRQTSHLATDVWSESTQVSISKLYQLFDSQFLPFLFLWHDFKTKLLRKEYCIQPRELQDKKYTKGLTVAAL